MLMLLLLRLLVAGLVKDSAAVVTGFGNNGDVAFVAATVTAGSAALTASAATVVAVLAAPFWRRCLR
jgi:hypothetical protein